MGYVKRILFFSLFIGVSMLFSVPSWAQGTADGKWQFSAIPYVWLVFLDGDATVGGHTTKVDTNIFELIDNSDSFFALQGHFEVSNGQWGGFFDATFMNLGVDVNVDGADADISVEYRLVELGGFYRVSDTSQDAGSAGAGNRGMTVDVLAGGRYTSLSSDLDISSGIFAGSFGGTKDWIDPFIGGRVSAGLSDRSSLLMRADIGGFGVGSDFTWNVLGAYNYNVKVFRRKATAIIGYRALYQDYSSGTGSNKFALDQLTHGPILGIRFDF